MSIHVTRFFVKFKREKGGFVDMVCLWGVGSADGLGGLPLLVRRGLLKRRGGGALERLEAAGNTEAVAFGITTVCEVQLDAFFVGVLDRAQRFFQLLTG